MTISSYAATYAAAQVIKALPRERLSRAVGRLCDTRVPAPLTKLATAAYARAYGVNLSEAEPRLAYDSFDEFFTRRLKPGARPLADCPIISPSDGNVVGCGPVVANGALPVKGQHYSLAGLLGDADEAASFEGGSFAVIYLSPRDYHRVHSPIAGRLRQVRSLAGERFPVNTIGERHFDNLLAINQRVAVTLESERLGRVAVILVGAIIVGRITVSVLGGKDTPEGLYRFDERPLIEQGEELGVFHLGSTVVLVVEPGVALSSELGPVRFGEALQGG